MAHFWRLRPLRPRANYGAGQTQMSRIALIDTRLKIPGESIGTIVSTHETIGAAFKANEAFQKRMRESGVKDHVPTKTRKPCSPLKKFWQARLSSRSF